MNKPPFTVERTSSYDPLSESWSQDIFVKLHVSARTSGLMGALGPERWHTLCCLATFMDEEGQCFPSVDQVAAALDITSRRAQDRLKSLCEFDWNSKQLVRRTKKRHNGGMYANYRYTILPISQLSIFNGKIEALADADVIQPPDVDRKTKDVDVRLTRTKNESQKELDNNSIISTSKEIEQYNAPDMIHYFAAKYKEKYGVEYVPNYTVDGRQMKTKLLKAFGPVQLAKVIDATFVYYDQKWATPQFPRPTIGALASWLANKVVALVDDKPKQTAPQSTSSKLDYDKLLRDGK